MITTTISIIENPKQKLIPPPSSSPASCASVDSIVDSISFSSSSLVRLKSQSAALSGLFPPVRFSATTAAFSENPSPTSVWTCSLLEAGSLLVPLLLPPAPQKRTYVCLHNQGGKERLIFIDFVTLLLIFEKGKNQVNLMMQSLLSSVHRYLGLPCASGATPWPPPRPSCL